MYILQAVNIVKQYGVRTVLDFDSFQVYEGDKIGIVGANGAGKTTLLAILGGELKPDAGTVTRHCEAAFIRQLPKMEQALSGGENAKRQIQLETGANDAIVFADEPTANLDEAGVAWVKGKLQAAQTVLLVSHDRSLLDSICTRIVEIRDGKLHHYTGNYSDYEHRVEEQKRQQKLEYERYKQKKAQLEAAVQVKEQKVAHQRQKKRREYATNLSEARLGGHKRKASMKKQEQQRKVLEARLDRLEQVDRPKDQPLIAIDFSLTHPPGNKIVVSGENLRFSYGENVVLNGASFTVKNGVRLAITGSNGAGKSTLLKMIHEESEGIRRAPKLKTGFLYQSFENLEPDRTILENVMSTSVQEQGTVRNMLAGLLFRGDDVFKKVGVLSGGEKMRVSLAKLIVGDNNALLLDEPTNYLDIRSLEAVERVLGDYPGTMILVSHDRRFLEAVTNEELLVEGGELHPMVKQIKANPAEKTLLELRRVRLLTEISSAPLDKKLELEKEYAQVIEALKAI